MSGWAHGFDVAVLQRVVDVFARHDDGYALGAFTRVSKPVVAEWLAHGELRDVTARPLVVSRRVRRVASVRDFTGLPVTSLPIGALHVRRVAFDDCDAPRLVELLRRERRVLFEGWAESPAHRAVADAAGLTRVGTKVRSSSDLVALWGRGLTARPRDPAELVGMSRLSLSLDVAAAVAELSLVDRWVDHYSNYNTRHSWHAIALRSYGGDPLTIEKPAEMTRHWQQSHPAAMRSTVSNTELWDRLPAIAALVDAVPGVKQRVRLMRLTPGGGELRRHTDIGDPDAGIADGRVARVHVPLVTSDRVGFTSWPLDGSGPQPITMRRGETWYLDTRKPHAARNDGTDVRVHLVVDTFSSSSLRLLLPDTHQDSI